MPHPLAKIVSSLAAAVLALGALGGPAAAQVLAPRVEAPAPPSGTDLFSLDLDGIRKYSATQNFEILGHSYFKIPERTPYAKAQGRAGPEMGSGFNLVRVYDGIAYLAGYSGPPTLFGVIIADVRDPKNIKPLSFIPCSAGARCPYLRVNRAKKILMVGQDPDRGNPIQPPAGQPVKSGWAFYDVSNPKKPKPLSFVPVPAGLRTHGIEADDRYLYGCGQFAPELPREQLQIIDYSDPAHAKEISTWHIPGTMKGETLAPMDHLGPDGKPQILMCHELTYYNDRLYVAWRDAGMKILDIKDRTKPRLIGTFDYVPPYDGGGLGATHSASPVPVKPGENPDLVVLTDEIFDCPSGFGRILDISDLKSPDVAAGKREPNIQLLSTFRAPHVQDQFDHAKGDFTCPAEPGGPGGHVGNTTHVPWFDQRSPSLVYVSWYDEGIRVLDISNPYAPQFIGYYMSPRFGSASEAGAPGRFDRQTREVFQDPDTNLIYVTDGNGGGLTILRYTGPIPAHPPTPGAR